MDQCHKETRIKIGFSSRNKSIVREFVEILLFALLFLLFTNTYVWQNFKIPTESMENSLLVGDHLTVNTFIFNGDDSFFERIFPFRKIKRGDVIVFRAPRSERDFFIKRCIGLPGDVVEVIDDHVLVDGIPLEEEYAFYKDYGMERRDPGNRYRPMDYERLRPGLSNAGYRRGEDKGIDELRFLTAGSLEPYRNRSYHDWQRINQRLSEGLPQEIPPGFYLVMGDNRNFSNDSRYWGLVPAEMIRGRAWFVWWSYGEEMNSHTATGFQRLKLYAQVVVTFWTRTHVDESLRLIK